jgi:hypothetical protein
MGTAKLTTKEPVPLVDMTQPEPAAIERQNGQKKNTQNTLVDNKYSCKKRTYSYTQHGTWQAMTSQA